MEHCVGLCRRGHKPRWRSRQPACQDAVRAILSIRAIGSVLLDSIRDIELLEKLFGSTSTARHIAHSKDGGSLQSIHVLYSTVVDDFQKKNVSRSKPGAVEPLLAKMENAFSWYPSPVPVISFCLTAAALTPDESAGSIRLRQGGMAPTAIMTN
jgi:hypothetical protein